MRAPGTPPRTYSLSQSFDVPPLPDGTCESQDPAQDHPPTGGDPTAGLALGRVLEGGPSLG